MSPNPLASGRVRPAAEINRQIRALWGHPCVRLSTAERAEYERLLEEWAAAIRAEVVEAA